MGESVDDIMSEYDDAIDRAIEDARGVHAAVELMEKDKVGELVMEAAEGASFVDDSASGDPSYVDPPVQPERPVRAGPPQAVQGSVLEVLVPAMPHPIALEVINVKTNVIVISRIIPPYRVRPGQRVKQGQARIIRLRVRPGTYMARLVAVKKSLKFLLQGQAGRIDLR